MLIDDGDIHYAVETFARTFFDLPTAWRPAPAGFGSFGSTACDRGISLCGEKYFYGPGR
jgi:hypothetical protein